MKLILSLIFVVFLAPTKAASITDLFGDGVFGTQWGDKFESVLIKYPKAKKKSYGEIVWLEVKDSRKIFDIERGKERLHFTFDSEMRLNGVGATFDVESYATLTNKLTTLFGDFEKQNMTSATLIWKEAETSVSLTIIPTTFGIETMLSVGYSGLDAPIKDKESLGFQ